MQRRHFIKGSAILAGAAVTGQAAASINQAGKSQEETNKEIYEWRVYHFKNGGQKRQVDKFYKEALIPALNNLGVKVGAFGEYDLTDPPTVYYLLVYSSMAEYHKIKKAIWKDESFLNKSKSYFLALSFDITSACIVSSITLSVLEIVFVAVETQ